MTVDAIRTFAQRHPRAVDATLAVVVAVASATTVAGTGAGLAGWLCLVAVHLPLAWRRRVPVTVLWTVVGLTVVAWTVVRIDGGYPWVVIVLGVYTVARHRGWTRLLAPAAALAVVLAAGWAQSAMTLPQLTMLAALLTAAGLLGVTARTRRAYLAELEERAVRLARERDQQAHLAAAAERARIAREMHDIVTHNLAVMIALADGASLAARETPQRATDTLSTISTTGRQALGEMQRLLRVLRGPDPSQDLSPGRAPQPGLADLDALVAQVRSAGLDVTLDRDADPGECGPGAGLAIYRIVQEALTNTLEHAGPRACVSVRLARTDTGVEVEVVDDGAGRPASPATDAPTGGHGLPGMVERAAAFGGRVDAGPRPDVGWRVHVSLDLADAEEPG